MVDSVKADEGELVERLRAGDERAFEELVERYYGPMFRLAELFVATREAAEDVVQDAWLAVVQGIKRFEERASLKTWLSRIVMNKARTRGTRDKRTVAYSSLSFDDADRSQPAVDPERFLKGGPDRGHWSLPPRPWVAPEQNLLTEEMMAVVHNAVQRLPAAQQTVITLRDVHGLDAEEVCNTLGVSETNQRVLLHRARSKVRSAVESHFGLRMSAA
jgi:RNA polymerase sigma-70 factor, ECF subfamily